MGEKEGGEEGEEEREEENSERAVVCSILAAASVFSFKKKKKKKKKKNIVSVCFLSLICYLFLFVCYLLCRTNPSKFSLHVEFLYFFCVL